jgi:hypothetical protein
VAPQPGEHPIARPQSSSPTPLNVGVARPRMLNTGGRKLHALPQSQRSASSDTSPAGRAGSVGGCEGGRASRPAEDEESADHAGRHTALARSPVTTRIFPGRSFDPRRTRSSRVSEACRSTLVSRETSVDHPMTRSARTSHINPPQPPDLRGSPSLRGDIVSAFPRRTPNESQGRRLGSRTLVTDTTSSCAQLRTRSGWALPASGR